MEGILYRGIMEDTELYRDNSSDSLRDAREFLERYADWMVWDDCEVILDVGCGPGDVTVNALRPILPESTKIIGCDLSPSMVDFSNAKYRDSKTSFELIDITSKQTVHDRWRKASINKIFSFYAIHALRLQRDAVANMSYLLKPGGQLLLLFPIDIPMFRIYTNLLLNDEWKDYHELIRDNLSLFVKWDSPSEVYTRILCEENFTDIGCNIIFASFCIPSVESYLKLFQAVSPIIRKLPEEMKSKLMIDGEKIIRENNLLRETKDGVVYSYRLMEVTATRR